MAIKFTQITDHTNQRIINVASPTLDTDAANKIYVDNIAQGLSWKQAARVASTGNINLASPGATIDGVTLNNGDRVLVKDQTDAKANGIYVFNGATSAMTRAADADGPGELSAGSALSVAEGTVNGDKTYVLVTDNPITIGTTPLMFSLMNGGSGVVYTAGNGIDTTGNQISIKLPATGSGLISSTGGLSVDYSTIVRKIAFNVGGSNSVTLTHNLNTYDVTVELYVNGGGRETVYAEVQRPDMNTVTIVFGGSAPAADAYRAVIRG